MKPRARRTEALRTPINPIPMAIVAVPLCAAAFTVTETMAKCSGAFKQGFALVTFSVLRHLQQGQHLHGFIHGKDSRRTESRPTDFQQGDSSAVSSGRRNPMDWFWRRPDLQAWKIWNRCTHGEGPLGFRISAFPRTSKPLIQELL